MCDVIKKVAPRFLKKFDFNAFFAQKQFLLNNISWPTPIKQLNPMNFHKIVLCRENFSLFLFLLIHIRILKTLT